MSRLFAHGYALVVGLACLMCGYIAQPAPPKAALPKPKPFLIHGRDDLVLRMGAPYKTGVLGEDVNAQLKGGVCTIWAPKGLWVMACWPKK